jgi:hypothetical protein
MKIKLQINGESLLGTDETEMNNSEYEIEMTIDEQNLSTLMKVLERATETSEDIFNWNITDTN